MFINSKDEDSEIQILDTFSTGFFMLIFNTANGISIVHHNHRILLLRKNCTERDEHTNQFYSTTVAANRRDHGVLTLSLAETKGWRALKN